MAIITLRLNAVKTHPEERPTACRYCGHSILQKWGTVAKPVRDPQVHQVLVARYRCCRCQRTFRHYPQGVERADQSVRLQQLAAIGWSLGLSTRGVSGFLGAFCIRLAHMTVWRDVQQRAQPLKECCPGHPVRVLGLDGVYGRMHGQAQAMTVAVDLGNGQPLALVQIDEHDPQHIIEWLAPLKEEWGIEVIVSDDLKAYRQVAEQLDVQHQICHFHLQRWVGRTLKDLAGSLGAEWQSVVEQIRQVVKTLPTTGRATLFDLYTRLPAESRARRVSANPLYRLRQLVLRLSEHWEQYCLYQQRADVPRTNNRTEQAIGHWRTRSRSVRGFKSWAGLHSAFVLCAESAF